MVKYAKPAGVIASIVPMTNPELTPPGTAIYAVEARDAVIFSPHPRTRRTTNEVVRLLREVMVREGAPADVFQCVDEPSIPLSQELMARCDLTLATGGAAMVRAAYSSGKPAFGVGGGNSTMVIDETADIDEAARNTRLSKTSDYGSGCSADGNLLIDDRVYQAMLARLRAEGGHLATPEQKALLERAMWDDEGMRIVATVAQPAPKLAAAAGFGIAGDRTFIVVEQDEIGPEHRFSGKSSRRWWPPTGTTASTTLSPRSGGSTRWPARAIPAGSSPSTTTTSTPSPASHRSAASWSANLSRRRTRGRSPTACP